MRVFLVCLSLVALVACGEKSPAAKSIKPSGPAYAGGEIIDLVPADATVVVRVNSLQKLEEIVGQVVRETGARVPTNPLMMSGIDPSQVDNQKPFAIAVTVTPTSPMPMPTYIVPVHDPKAVAAAHRGGGTAVRGGYVAVSMNSAYKPGGSKLIGAMHPGDVSVRVDLETIIALYRPNIDQASGFMSRMVKRTARQQAPGVDTQLVVDSVATWVKDMLDSAETLDVVMSLDDGTLDVDVAYTALEGSALGEPAPAGTLAELAQHLPGDMPIVALWKLDLAAWMDAAQSLSDAMAANLSEEDRQKLKAQVEESKAMMREFGDEWVIGLDFDGGLRMVCALRAENASGLVDRYAKLMLGDGMAVAGADVTDEGVREVAGNKVRRLRLKLNPEQLKLLANVKRPIPVDAMHKLVGEDGMVLDLAAKGGCLVVAVDGRGEVMDGMLAANAVPGGVQHVLDRVGGDVRFLMHFDMRALMSGLQGMVPNAPAVKSGAPLPLTLYRTNDGRVYRVGMSVKPTEMAAFLKTFSR